MSAVTPEQQEQIEVASIRLKLAVEAGDVNKVVAIVDELEVWVARTLLAGIVWVVFDGKQL